MIIFFISCILIFILSIFLQINICKNYNIKYGLILPIISFFIFFQIFIPIVISYFYVLILFMSYINAEYITTVLSALIISFLILFFIIIFPFLVHLCIYKKYKKQQKTLKKD